MKESEGEPLESTPQRESAQLPNFEESFDDEFDYKKSWRTGAI